MKIDRKIDLLYTYTYVCTYKYIYIYSCACSHTLHLYREIREREREREMEIPLLTTAEPAGPWSGSDGMFSWVAPGVLNGRDLGSTYICINICIYIYIYTQIEVHIYVDWCLRRSESLWS